MAQKKKAVARKEEEFRAEWQSPLKWLEAQPRTRHQDRIGRSNWKGSIAEYRKRLDQQLKRMGIKAAIVSSDFDRETAHQNTGVTIFFTRKGVDFGWQEALGFVGIVPSVEEINAAYRKLAPKYHPDSPTADPEGFRILTKHRDNARAWVTGTYQREHESAMACDTYNEIRLNVNAICVTLKALKIIEEHGASALYEVAMSAFNRKMIAAGGGSASKTA